jgi:hypothetical protein
MTQCPGLVERLKLEMSGMKVNISVDENLLWRASASTPSTMVFSVKDRA